MAGKTGAARRGSRRPLALKAKTAAELMSANPVSINQDAPLEEAVGFLSLRGFSAAPVIDDGGRPVGVISRSDIAAYTRASGGNLHPACLVKNVMSPVVYSLPPDAPAHRVVTDMVGLNVHRLFIVDATGVLIGVVSALDVLRHLEA